MKSVPRRCVCAMALIVLLLLAALTSYAGSATWLLNPINGNWNSSSNWTPATVPNGASDTATFATSNRISVSLSQNTTVAGIVFDAGAAAFNITVTGMLALNLGEAGLSNNSSNAESFSTAGGTQSNLPGAKINFSNSASAGSANFYNNGASVIFAKGGATSFMNTTTASFGSFTNYGATGLYATGGETNFRDSATAANGTFTNVSAATINSNGGRTAFYNAATAGSGTFYQLAAGNGTSGSILFSDGASAANASFFNDGKTDGQLGGFVFFDYNSSAGSATFLNRPGLSESGLGGAVSFSANSTAANAHFINDTNPGVGSGNTGFAYNSSAGQASFTNYGGKGPGDFGGATNINFNATAGSGTFDNNGGAVSGAYGGYTRFRYDYNGVPQAGSGIFNNFGGEVKGAYGGFTDFYENATGENGTFNNNGGAVSGARGGSTIFYDSSTAGDGTFNNNGGSVTGGDGGNTSFYDSSTAGNSMLIANNAVGLSSSIAFADSSTGGTARVKIFGNGYLAIDSHAFGTVTVGSIEGDGTVYTRANNLSVGTNNLATSFSGFVDDGNAGGGFVKTGGGLLTFENRADNNYLSDTLTLSVANNSVINLNYSGTPDTVRSLIIGGVPQLPGLYGSVASEAPNQRAQFAGSGQILVTTFAVSRKMQGANSYDIDLPLAGPVGVECRVGGSYQIVVRFVSAVSFTSANVTSGTGSVSGTSGNNSSTVTIDLTGVTSPQRIAVTLFGVNDSSATNNLVIPMGVLIGDTSGNGLVNASDVSQTKAQSGQPISASNFRTDVSGNGLINASDVTTVKLASGTALPVLVDRPSPNPGRVQRQLKRKSSLSLTNYGNKVP